MPIRFSFLIAVALSNAALTKASWRATASTAVSTTCNYVSKKNLRSAIDISTSIKRRELIGLKRKGSLRSGQRGKAVVNREEGRDDGSAAESRATPAQSLLFRAAAAPPVGGEYADQCR